jgi:hypothetical protein
MTSLTLTSTMSYAAKTNPKLTLQTLTLAKDGYALGGVSGAAWMAILGFGIDVMHVLRLPFTLMMRLRVR